jgi:hypothetical protein
MIAHTFVSSKSARRLIVELVSYQFLMMGTEKASETSVIFDWLTRMIARENYISFGCRESFRSYNGEESGPDLFYSSLWRVRKERLQKYAQ